MTTNNSINLDAARTARAERRRRAKQKPGKLVFGGDSFKLPEECPVDFAIALAFGDSRGAVAALLGPDALAKFWSHTPSTEDMNELTARVADFYGLPNAPTEDREDEEDENESAEGSESPESSASGGS